MASVTCSAAQGTVPEASGELRLRIIFSEDEAYVFGKGGESARQTITIATGAAAGCDRIAWRDAFKKKKSHELIDCRNEASLRMPQLA